LNYELETYMDALKGIPTIEGRLKTKKGDAVLQKTDIFKRMMWFGIVGEESVWIPVSSPELSALKTPSPRCCKSATLSPCRSLRKTTRHENEEPKRHLQDHTWP
jgi:hypothetical protein